MNMLATFAKWEREIIRERIADMRGTIKARGERSAMREALRGCGVCGVERGLAATGPPHLASLDHRRADRTAPVSGRHVRRRRDFTG